MKVSQLFDIIEKITPFELAQSWDNVGLLLGCADSDVEGVMFAVDVTAAVAEEAVKNGCNTIISYHPVIWDGLKKITNQCQRNIVYKLLRNGINVISIHTALDAAQGGVNDCLAEAAGIIKPEPISDYVSISTEDSYKFVVFVPADNINEVSRAVFETGAGAIGNYNSCGFTTEGEGSFMPLKGSNPSIGRQNRLEKVREIRFETIVKASKLADVIQAMKTAHTYEMPAYDVIKLDLIEKRFGIGRFGKLLAPRKSADILAALKELTKADMAGVVGDLDVVVKSAAVCAGSCGSILNKVIANKCDMYITGELKHHDALAAKEAGLLCVCLGHSWSERFILAQLLEKIAAKAPNTPLKLSAADTDPFQWRQI